ncbi:MAG: outer membrane protein assembly factor BamD [Holophaga sp.]|nr:outer membrane protein assembly factor BamD [Holophaga sp.]
MQLRNLALPLLLATLTVSGGLACKKSTKGPKKDDGSRTAAQLMNESSALMKRGKWEEGRRLLRVIEEQLPGSAEFPEAKLSLGDSFFFQGSSTFPEALVEYQSFLNYFPRHEKRDLAMYHVALCHYAAIENAERDQAETRKALESFQNLIREVPGSPYVVDAKTKTIQCWRRLAEHELMVGVHYVNSYNFAAAERRLKGLLETYPDYVDRERAYYFLGEAMRRKFVPNEILEQNQKDFLAKVGKEDISKLDKAELEQAKTGIEKLAADEIAKYRQEARSYFQKLVESYPNSEWTARAKDRLLEMGQTHVKEELDS